MRRTRAHRRPAGAAAGDLARSAGVATLILLSSTASAAAQTIVGRILDESSEAPVFGAVVELVGFTGEVDAQTLSDDEGAFRITPTRIGEYYLRASRLGYETGSSPLLMLETEGTAPLDLLLRPAPIGLRGLEVTVDRLERIRSELRFAGVTPEQLGQRFVTRADFEHLLPRSDVGHLLEWTNIAGIGFWRSEDLSFLSDDIGLCVYLERARPRGGGWSPCALGVLDGVPVPGTLLQAINPYDVAAMAVLTPQEAGMLFGRLGRGGAVMVWRTTER